VKVMLDQIFLGEQFQNKVIWYYRGWHLKAPLWQTP
jgi:adenine specific DNA methylase Mod